MNVSVISLTNTHESTKKEGTILFALLLLMAARVSFPLATGTHGASAQEVLTDVLRVPQDFATIQEAVNAADPCATIWVATGTYFESIIVDKDHLTIIGEDKHTTILDGNESRTPVKIAGNNITVQGFTIQKSGSMRPSLLIEHAQGCNIEGNILSDNREYCLLISNSSDNTVTNNVITRNREYGVKLLNSHGNTLTNNTILDNAVYGIQLEAADRNTIRENAIEASSWDNIFLWQSNNNIVAENTLRNGEWDGIRLAFSDNNTITKNLIENNTWDGIRIRESENNIITHNMIANNLGYGIRFYNSNHTAIYLNSFINTHQIILAESYENEWTNLNLNFGNYWSDYAGEDADNDGIGDSSYVVSREDHDIFPLMGPINTFDTSTWNDELQVYLISNSTISGFNIDTTPKTLSFNVTGIDSTMGFCRMNIPNIIIQDLWQGNFSVLVNGQTTTFQKWTDATYTCIYFTYALSEHKVTIIPEFQLTTILLVAIAHTTSLFIVKKRRKSF